MQPREPYREWPLIQSRRALFGGDAAATRENVRACFGGDAPPFWAWFARLARAAIEDHAGAQRGVRDAVDNHKRARGAVLGVRVVVQGARRFQAHAADLV